jgi:hypothetical protein
VGFYFVEAGMDAAKIQKLIEALTSSGQCRIILTGPGAESRRYIANTILDELALESNSVQDILIVVEEDKHLDDMLDLQQILTLSRGQKYPCLIRPPDVDKLLGALDSLTKDPMEDFKRLIDSIGPDQKQFVLGIPNKRNSGRTLLNGATGSERKLHAKKGSAKAHDPRVKRRGY